MKKRLEFLIYLLNRNQTQGVNGEVKLFVKIYSNYDPGIQTSITLVIFFVLTWWIIEFKKNIWFFSFIISISFKPHNFSFLLNVTYTFKAVFPHATFRIHFSCQVNPCASLANKEVQTVFQFYLKVIKFVVKVKSVHDCKKLIAIFLQYLYRFFGINASDVYSWFKKGLPHKSVQKRTRQCPRKK